VAELFDDAAQPQVVGAEVVPPGRDAVRLVDDEQRRPGVVQRIDHLRLGQLLGGEEHEADRSVRQCLEHLALIPGREAGVELGRPPGLLLDLAQPFHLVALQRDQR
jgi:hypothetical protein